MPATIAAAMAGTAAGTIARTLSAIAMMTGTAATVTMTMMTTMTTEEAIGTGEATGTGITGMTIDIKKDCRRCNPFLFSLVKQNQQP